MAETRTNKTIQGNHIEERCCRWWDPRLNNFPYDIYLNDSTDPYSVFFPAPCTPLHFYAFVGMHARW